MSADERRRQKASGGGPTSWIDAEPSSADDRRETWRLFARGWARPALTLLLALTMAAVVVGMRARKVDKFAARVVLRVTEGDLDFETAPPPNAQLRGYIYNAVFSTPRLLEVIRARHLYAGAFAVDPDRAVELMRDDIKIEVWRNYFISPRAPDDPPRSARLSISYTANDPELAYAVVQDLKAMLIADEALKRATVADRAMADVELALGSLRTQLEAARALQAALALELQRAPKTPLALRLADLHQSIVGLEEQQHTYELRSAALERRSRIEHNRMGLVFQIVDDGRVPPMGLRRPVKLAVLGGAVFFLVLPLCAIAIGAFDTRVRNLDDVRRLGLQPLGHLGNHGAPRMRV
jgi:hypothetical protein